MIGQMKVLLRVKELKEQAQPKFFLQKPTTQEELERDVKRAIQGGAPQSKPPVR